MFKINVIQISYKAEVNRFESLDHFRFISTQKLTQLDVNSIWKVEDKRKQKAKPNKNQMETNVQVRPIPI